MGISGRASLGTSLLLAAVAMLTWLVPVPSAAYAIGIWTPQPSGTTQDLHAVHFLNTMEGWVVGGEYGGGVILRTVNGGATWTPQASGVTDVILNSVFFINRSKGWVTGYDRWGGSYVLSTIDGGENWSAQHFDGVQLLSVHFTSEEDGKAAGFAYVSSHYEIVTLTTANGGTSWARKSVTVPGDPWSFPNSIVFTSATQGWAAGVNGSLSVTVDGGDSWTAQTSGTTNHINDIFFMNSDRGWATNANTTLKTTNGGTDWASESTGPPDRGYLSLFFTDASNGWAVGYDSYTANHGTISATADGGLTWELQYTGTTTESYLYSNYHVDSSHGWAVGSGGTILAYSDGPLISTYTITASAGPGGSIDPSGSQTVSEGDDISFTIAPDPGYKIGSVTADGASQGAVASYRFTNVTADHTISATFAKDRPTIVLISGIESQTFYKKDGKDHLDTSDWQALIAALRKNGYDDGDILVAKTHKGGPDGYAIDSQSGNWDNCAKELARQIAEKSGTGPVILVGHSMGGLIARAYADNWKAPQAYPLAIIQLGTPNSGAPSVALDYVFPFWRVLAVGNSAAQMLGTRTAMALWNFSHANTNDVPIYRIAGAFFPGTALSQTELWPPSTVAAQVAAQALVKAWHPLLASDAIVTDQSVKGGPSYDPGRSVLNFPAVHARNLPLGLVDCFPKAGSLLPKSSSNDADKKVVDQIIKYVEDASSHSSAGGGGGGGRSIATLSQTLAATERAAYDLDTAPGWTTCAAESVSLTGGPAVTAFTVEGTSASIIAAADSGGVSLEVKDALGVGVPCATTTESSVTEGAIYDVTPGEYTLTVAASSGTPTQAEVRVQDTGASSLRLLVPGQVQAGASFTAKAAVYESGGSSEAPTFARSAKPLAVSATGEGAELVSLRDDGVAPDEEASDGIYAATLTAPSSGSAWGFAVTATGEDGTGVGFVRKAQATVAVAEPRATLSGPFGYRLKTDSSSKITDLLVDVTVDAAEACSLRVAVDIGSGGALVAQSAADAAFTGADAKTLTVTVPMSGLYPKLAADGSFSVSRVVLNDYTDEMPTLLDEKLDVASGTLSLADVHYSRCTAALTGPNPAVSSDVSITGDAVCTTEPISAVEYSVDAGISWTDVPAPAGGWGDHTEAWDLPLHLADGFYSLTFRARGDSGPLAGAESWVSFGVDTASPYGSFILAGGATTTSSVNVTADATVDNMTAPVEMRFSFDFGLSWSNWEPFSAQKTVTLPGSSGPKTVYVEYRDAASQTLELDDAIELSLPIDTTAPTTAVSGADALWHNTPVTITLTPTDDVGGSGMVGGLAKTEYKLDSGDWTTGTSVTVAAPASHANDGSHTISYRSTDAAGNVEEAKTCTVNIDTIVPSTSASPPCQDDVRRS